MHTKTILPFILGAVIFISACSHNLISLDYTNAKGEVPQLGNLVFRFSRPVMADSLLNTWDSSEFISFEPRIAGRFRWESPDQLVFSPSSPLAPATNYKASIRKEVLRYSKYDKLSNGDQISFHTPDLKLDNTSTIWLLQDEGSKVAIPQISLFFNYPVNPTELKNKLDLQVDDHKVDYSLLTTGTDNKITLRINGLKAEDRDYAVKVTIDKGLKPEKGNNLTTTIISSALNIPSPYVLMIQNIEAEHDGVEGTVRVTTSQQLAADNISSLVKLDPNLKFTIETTEDGFSLHSDKFDVEKSYAITIAKGLRGKIGGVLKEDYSGNVAFGELEAGIKFTNSKAVYLSKNGGKNIEVQVTNVPKIKVIVSKIYENNLLFAQRFGYEPREKNETEYGGYGEENVYSEQGADLQIGDVVYEKEMDTRLLPKSGAGRLFSFADIEDKLPEFKGIYHIVIRSMKDYWVRDSRFISSSDIGMIAKEGSEKIFVFANSIKTATPVGGANVTVYSGNNQLIGSGATNENGVAEIAYAKKDFAGFRPAMLIIKTADDFNYLPFSNTKVNTSRFEVGGKRNNAAGLDAFIYAERDIYRPGEKLNYSVIVRDRQWKSPGEMPLKFKFLLPNGKELKSFRKNLNEGGATEGSIETAVSSITGTYTLEVYTSTDILLGSKNFSVEEFVPDRIKVTAKTDKESLRPGESTTFRIAATNFFGPPAANRNYETEIQVKQKYFSPEKFGDYDFSLANQSGFHDKDVQEGKTDAQGNASGEFMAKSTYANMGVLQANFYATVFDETGRPVSRSTSLDIFTQDIFYGIRNDWFYYYPLNQAVKFPVVAVNKDGRETASPAKIQVVKHEYRTVLTKNGSYFRYESQKEDRVMAESEVNVGANYVYTYTPRSPGDYEVRVYRPGATTYVARSFYSYGGWGGDNNSFEVSNEGNVDIELDKKSYLTGEKAIAHFKTPFSGKLLVTMETDHLVSYQYLDVSNRDASMELLLNGEHVPNVYITATLFKPHELSDIPLMVAHGFQSIKVEEKSRRIGVNIVAAKSVRSHTHQKVTVKADPGSFVTLAAVDNGVLQVSDFKTPDPYNYFYQKKALQVSAYDLYPLLFPEMRAIMSSTGGDADLSMEKRVNPMPAKRIKILSYWSGIAKVNGSGSADFEFDIPQFSGEVRLMAVAYSDQRFGSAENTMTVADPIVISTALPRFLSPGDTVTVPVTLSNTTSKASSVSATIGLQGPLKVAGPANQKMEIAAKSEGRATFRIFSDAGIGVGKVLVSVDGAGEKFKDETEISVRPPSTLQKVTGAGSITGGTVEKLKIGLSDFMPASVNYQLVLSRSPALEVLGSQLSYLVQYPYGCTEQTVSAAFPQLYYGDLADLMQLSKGGKANANANILEAIRKIKMRQLYNGAVTLWDGEGKEDWWATIYAAHFLLEARKAGFDVDNSLLETMLGYISNRLKSRQLITYYYNRDQNRKIAPKEVAYGLYVLALAGHANIAAMNYYKATPGILALDSRYLLSAAYATAGDKRSFSEMLPAAFSGEESVAQSGGSYYSDLRDESIALNALMDVDPTNAQVATMARHVGDKLKSRYWLSTQERAFAFLALGKIAKNANQSTVSAEIKVNGKTVATIASGQWRGDKNALQSNEVEIVTRGEGRLYYFWQAEGISATGTYKEEDSYLKVRKRFFDRFGKPINGNTFKQNDLVIVGISLERSFDTPVENVVITDLLPAGFEIENPRTKEIPGMDWIKDAATPTSIDVRDDRIHFFVDMYNNKQTYYYAVRAVSPGEYKMGPVNADAMYKGEYHSYNGAGTIRVLQ